MLSNLRVVLNINHLNILGVDMCSEGVSLTVRDLLRQDARIQDLYFKISYIKLSITTLYIISDASKYYNIWTENSDVIDSFISEILKYKSWILASWRKRSWTVRFTPLFKCGKFYQLGHGETCSCLIYNFLSSKQKCCGKRCLQAKISKFSFVC